MQENNQGKPGMLKGLTPKQKGMAAALVVIVLFLIYMMKDMFGGDSVDTTITPTPAPTAMSATAPGTAPTMTPASPAVASTPAAPVPVKAVVAQDPSLLNKQKEDQEKYIETVNRLQMLKLEKDIAETSQAISAATLATKTAEKSINELFV
jgi:hypothetical protein